MSRVLHRARQRRSPRLERAVERSPNDPSALGSLAAAYLSTAIQIEDTSYFGRAEALLDRIDEIAPDLDRTLIARGVLALSRHRFALALDYGSRVHDRSPAQPDALAVLVDATVELGRYDEAGAYLQELLDRRPGLPGVLACLVPSGAPRRRRTARCRDARSRGGRGRIRLRARPRRRRSSAISHSSAATSRPRTRSTRDALERRPGLVFAEYGRARVLAAHGRYEEAIDVLAATLERSQLPAAITLAR